MSFNELMWQMQELLLDQFHASLHFKFSIAVFGVLKKCSQNSCFYQFCVQIGGSGWGGGSGNHYSLKQLPIIHLIKNV